MNLVEKLMKMDRNKLEQIPMGEVEIKRLSDLCGEPFIVKCKAISGNRHTELTALMTNKKGDLDLGKAYKVNTLMVVEGVVEPDLKNEELQKHFGCKTPKDLAEKLFPGGDMAKVGELISELSGFTKETDEEIKN